jgi:type II secretory pathway component GspD/PulD (secretin)
LKAKKRYYNKQLRTMEENMQSGCFQGHRKKWKLYAGLFGIIGIFLVITSICVAQGAARQPVLRNRVYKLQHISAGDAKERLVSLGIGRNINELPHNSLIVESDNPGDLVKASSLLSLIDSEQSVVVKTILTEPDIQKLPRNDQIAAEVGNINIGTFKSPPIDKTRPRVIVDIHNRDLIAIAPEPLFSKITDAVVRLQTTSPAAEKALAPVEFTEPNVIEPAFVPEFVEAEVQPEIEGAEVEAEVEEDTSAAELLEIMADIQAETDAEGGQAKDDFFGDELLEVLAEAEKAAEAKFVPQIDEIEEEIQPAEEFPKVAFRKESEDLEPAQPKTETIGITKEDLAAIVQAEVAKLLKAQAAAEKAEKAVSPPVPIVPSVQPVEKKAEPVAEAEHAEPVEIKAEVSANAYLDQLAIPDAEKELELTLTLPEKVEISALLEMVGKLLGLNYIYDEKQVKGDVMLKIHGGKVKVKDAYALLESVLKFRGFVMTRRGQLVTIVPQAEALDYDPTLRTSPKDIQPGDVIVTSIFHLKHVDTASAEALLKSMKLGTTINAIPETGTLIVTGYAYRMSRIEGLLKMIDVRGKPRKFHSRQLQHTVVTEILSKVQTLAEQLGTVAVSISVSKTSTAAAAKAGAKPQTAAERRAAQRRGTTPAKQTTISKKAAAPGKQPVYLDADERTNRVLMIGLAEDIDIVNELLDSLDVEKPDLRIIKEYEIQHVDPSQIIDTLGELGLITPRSRSTSQRRTTTSARQSTTTGTATGNRSTTAARRGGTTSSSRKMPSQEDEPQISVLAATNSLLINALPAQHAMIALVIAHVDRELDEATLPYVIYPLENQDPQELADVLAKLIEKTTRAKATAAAKDAKVQTRPTTTSTSTTKLQDEIQIVADIKSYSLIVYASKKNQQWIGTLIKKLDEYRAMVLLDCTLVEITKNDEFTYDLNLLSSLPDLTDTSGLTSPIMKVSDPGNFGAPDRQSDLVEKLGRPGSRDRFIDFQAVSGAGTGFYADRFINLLLTTVQSKGYGRILARPKLLVNDNEQGTIKTTENVPIVSVETKIVAGSASTVSTAAPSVKIDTYTAGVTLDIQPHISKGEQLRLIMTLTRTDFRLNDDYSLSTGTENGIISGPTPPDLLTSDITTTVTVPDKHTIIVGGLEKIAQSKGGNKVPLLGDIPIIGGLFRNISNRDTQGRLYVFVKAHIVRPGEQVTTGSDILAVSQKNRGTFEQYETEMQEYEDWPGIKPKPMAPRNILESDDLVVP